MRPCMLLWPSTSPADSYSSLQGSGRLPAGTLEGTGAAPSQPAGRTWETLWKLTTSRISRTQLIVQFLEGSTGSPKTVRNQVATLVVWWERSTKLQELGTFWRLSGSLATSQDPGPSRLS